GRDGEREHLTFLGEGDGWAHARMSGCGLGVGGRTKRGERAEREMLLHVVSLLVVAGRAQTTATRGGARELRCAAETRAKSVAGAGARTSSTYSVVRSEGAKACPTCSAARRRRCAATYAASPNGSWSSSPGRTVGARI